MANIEVRKFQYAAGHLKNYFDSPTLFDTISFSRVMEISGYNKEYEKQFEAFAIQFSDVAVKISLTQTETSTLGRTVRQFFQENLDNHCLACKIDDGTEVIGGMIALESIWYDENLTNDGFNLSFRVFEFAQEFKKMGDRPPLIASTIAPSFSVFLNFSFFRNGNPGYWDFDTSEINWTNNGLGQEPYLIIEMWQQLIEQGHMADATIWELFKDLLKAWSLVYEFSLNGTFGNYYKVKIKLFFRTNPNATTISITRAAEPKHGNIRNSKAASWIFWKTGKSQASNVGDFEPMYGILSNGANPNYIATGEQTLDGNWAYAFFHKDGNFKVRNQNYPAGNEYSVPASDVKIEEFSQYFNTIVLDSSLPDVYRQWIITSDVYSPLVQQGQSYSFPAMWTKAGYTINVVGIHKKVQHSSYNLWAWMKLAWAFMGYISNSYLKTPYKFLYRDFSYKYFEIIIPISDLSGNQLFTKSNLYDTDVILYKLKEKSSSSREIKSVWYENRDN